MQKRQSELNTILERLLNSEEYAFDSMLHGILPDSPGIYAIKIKRADDGTYFRAGRTDISLKQRIYRNHYMGNQNGNLRQQLVRDGIVDDITATKRWIQDNCFVQFLVIEDDLIRQMAEYFMLSILRPKYCG